MRVLLIDDEEDIRKIGKLSLEAVGRYETSLAASGPEGIEMAMGQRPDVILMDMMMPGMDGLSALAALREKSELKEIPVIFMTAKVQPKEVAHYVEMGAVGVIRKPFDPMALPGEVKKILESRNASPIAR